ncbi:unnamed protein product [Rhizoctonia solani]|uniref:Uncharacterized protein n=1 Tax=Rhizoctonia solani TaxID=456999 RepID=A0A8H3HG13_9AGAM|nr:unnamed protein product [Rhizoctonia solani]
MNPNQTDFYLFMAAGRSLSLFVIVSIPIPNSGPSKDFSASTPISSTVLDQSSTSIRTMSSSHSLPRGIYRISDGSGRWLSQSGVKPGTGAGTQLVLLTEDEGTDAGFNWILEYDKSQSAYTLQNAASGLYASFEGNPMENAHLGAHPIPRYYDLVPNGSQGLKVMLRGSKLRLNTSPCMMYPPMIALSTDTNAKPSETSIVWEFHLQRQSMT